MTESKWITATEFMGSLFSDVDMESSEYIYYDTLGKISAELVNYRIKHGLSQAGLAKILGVTQAMVSKYESGDYNISLKAAIELFSKLGVSFSFNIGEEKTTIEMPFAEEEYTNSKKCSSDIIYEEYNEVAGAA